MAAAPDYGPLFQAAGQLHDIDPLLLQAIQQQESGSGSNPNVVGPPNKSGELAQGVMQFLPSTAARYNVNTSSPSSSIYGAGAYLADLRKYTNDNLPQMLAYYGGGAGATDYANQVIGKYRALQAAWKGGGQPSPPDDQGDKSSSETATSGDQGGIKITMKAAPGTGGAQQGGASFVPPPGVPDTFGKSDEPGSRAQHPLEASEYVSSDKPPSDFAGALFGKGATTEAPAAAPSPKPPADFQTQLFGNQPAVPAAAATGAQPAPGAQAAPEGIQPPAAPPAVAQLTPPPQPSWWQTNVAGPVAAMYDPRLSSVTTPGATTNALLQQPFLQNIGAGIMQGPRNVAQTANKWEQEADQSYPWLASLDRSIGETPEVLAARGKDLAAQTAAYRTQYGDSLEAAGGELAGNLLTTYPLAAGGYGLRLLGDALPFVRGATTVADMAGTPAAQNILTSPNKDWRTAGAEGAAGGLAVGGVLGSVAGQFTRGAVPQAVQEARNLGFDLTTGETAGGLAKNIEDVTQYLPGSGAAAKAAEHRSVVNTILNRNMGITGDQVNQATMQTARARAGNLMDQVRNVTVDANRDPQLLTQLGDIAHEAGQQPQTGNSITGIVDTIQNTAANNGGTLPGNVMHDLIKQGTPLDRLVNSRDPVIAQFARRIQTALQDSVSRSGDPAIYGPQQAAANQQAVDAFNQGRYFWKTIKTVEPLVDKTGSADDASYAGLARRIEGTPLNPNFDPRFQGNNTEMQTLARVLRGPLAELKSSGTGRQMLTAGLLGLGGGEGGLGMATHIFAPQNFGTYMQDVVAPTLAAIAGGRILRYGPGMGFAPAQAAHELFNPLLPRVLAPAVAGNPLLTGQPRP